MKVVTREKEKASEDNALHGEWRRLTAGRRVNGVGGSVVETNEQWRLGKPAGSRTGPTSRFPSGSPVLTWFANFQFCILNRAGKTTGSRSDRFNRPVFRTLAVNNPNFKK
ncbi:hypothetical protein PIB30_004030 [Stylosanthes scabra]|uniref:Uncharacterized protein n=1 Tax=Stylosanthes scabra TaxID=79078 RepID=A0ABU6X2T3_9FABA|nr:hypothetical protein [Stylosanthes scabra]